jgi:hypothetical protein
VSRRRTYMLIDRLADLAEALRGQHKSRQPPFPRLYCVHRSLTLMQLKRTRGPVSVSKDAEKNDLNILYQLHRKFERPSANGGWSGDEPSPERPVI